MTQSMVHTCWNGKVELNIDIICYNFKKYNGKK